MIIIIKHGRCPNCNYKSKRLWRMATIKSHLLGRYKSQFHTDIIIAKVTLINPFVCYLITAKPAKKKDLSVQTTDGGKRLCFTILVAGSSRFHYTSGLVLTGIPDTGVNPVYYTGNTGILCHLRSRA